MTKPVLLVLVILGILASSSCNNAETVATPPKEDEYSRVIERVRQAYSNCKIYQDTATFTSDRTPKRGSFATAFQRENQLFRLDCRYRMSSGKEEYEYILSEGDKATAVKGGVSTEMESLGSALSSFAPITAFFGSSIPRLLLPVNGDLDDFFTLLEKTSVEDGTLADVECYIVRGQVAGAITAIPPEPWVIWIRKEDALILRIDAGKSSATLSPTINHRSTARFSPWGKLVRIARFVVRATPFSPLHGGLRSPWEIVWLDVNANGHTQTVSRFSTAST